MFRMKMWKMDKSHHVPVRLFFIMMNPDSDCKLLLFVDLLNQWEKVEALAKCRQAQSRDLATMFATLQAIKCNIEGSSGPQACSDFTDLAELENYMRACQVCLVA